MATASGWDVLALTVGVTEAEWQVRVGLGFVLRAALVVSWLLEDEEENLPTTPEQSYR